MIAERVRGFFQALFHSERAASLEVSLAYMTACRISEMKASLANLEKERDYFRQRAERLELLLRREAPPVDRPRRVVDFSSVNRKSWAQVQADHARKMAEDSNGREKVSESRDAEAV